MTLALEVHINVLTSFAPGQKKPLQYCGNFLGLPPYCKGSSLYGSILGRLLPYNYYIPPIFIVNCFGGLGFL